MFKISPETKRRTYEKTIAAQNERTANMQRTLTEKANEEYPEEDDYNMWQEMLDESIDRDGDLR